MYSIFIIFLLCWPKKSQMDYTERILSRQRRFLLFPAGSSVQFVYSNDMYYPGWTPSNPITGVTAALAWGLPDRPSYPENEYMQSYADGHLPLLERKTETNATDNSPSNYTKTPQKSSSQINLETMIRLIRVFFPKRNSPNAGFVGVDSNRIEAIFDSIRLVDDIAHRQDSKKSKRFAGKDFSQSSHLPPTLIEHTRHVGNDAFRKYLAETYFNRWMKSIFDQSLIKSELTQPSKPAKFHAIYPAIGKRSLPSASTTKTENFFLDLHRSTRHHFYESVEKYLFAKGYNGSACVLKTLCEVGQKRSESEPSTFLAELIRVIFSLPAVHTKVAVDKNRLHYDEAHQATDDCTRMFTQCPDSVWNAQFMIEFYD